MSTSTFRPPQPQRCRACGELVYWALAETSGKRVPVDASSSERGTIRLAIRPGVGVVATLLERSAADAITGAAVLAEGRLPLRLNHFVSCPARRRQRAQRRATSSFTP